MSTSSGLPGRPEPTATAVPAHPPAAAPALPETASASVTASDGAVIATVARHIRPAGPGERGSEVVVTVQGDLDLEAAPLVQRTLTQALDGAERVCLDLGEVSFFGATGVRVVITARLHAISLGRAFRLTGVHGITARVLALSGLHPQG